MPIGRATAAMGTGHQDDAATRAPGHKAWRGGRKLSAGFSGAGASPTASGGPAEQHTLKGLGGQEHAHLRRETGSSSSPSSAMVSGGDSPTRAGSGSGGDESERNSSVSLLQEYVQRCSAFSPHTKILTWSFEQQLDGDTSLQFRATVCFCFGDVPHYFSGGWQTSKKKSQRDAAERVYHYLSRRFEEAPRPLSEEPSGPQQAPWSMPPPPGGDSPLQSAVDPRNLPDNVVEELRAVCQEDVLDDQRLEQAGNGNGCLEWKLEERKGTANAISSNSVGGVHCTSGSSNETSQFRATLTFFIHTVPHHFRGGWSQSARDAKRDAAARVLWYFGKGTEAYATVENASASQDVVAPLPPHLASLGGLKPDSASQDSIEDKTVLMQVQNLLQKTFSKDTPPGQRVWLWSYEADPRDPQRFRASVEVPSWGRTFHGDWRRGKKLAQRSACLAVKDHLDNLMGTQ